MNSLLFALKVRRFLTHLSELDRDRFIRQQEDLCIVLSHPDFRPILPKVFTGISGPYVVSFETSSSVSRGNPHAMYTPISRMVKNELNVTPGKNIHQSITEILQSSEALCEHGYACVRNGNTEVIGGFFSNEVERKSMLNAIVGSGLRRITLDVDQLVINGQRISSSLQNTSERKGFIRSLGEGKSVLDAAVSASIISRELAEFGRGIAVVSNTISSWSKAKKGDRR